MLHERWGNKGGLKMEIFKKLILVNIAVVDIFRPVLTSYGTVSNGKGVYKLLPSNNNEDCHEVRGKGTSLNGKN